MTTHNEFTERALVSLRSQVAQRRSVIDRALEDVGTLMQAGALQSFVHTFLEREDSLLDELLDARQMNGGTLFHEQSAEGLRTLEYRCPRSGSVWRFDVDHPAKGWE